MQNSCVVATRRHQHEAVPYRLLEGQRPPEVKTNPNGIENASNSDQNRRPNIDRTEHPSRPRKDYPAQPQVGSNRNSLDTTWTKQLDNQTAPVSAPVQTAAVMPIAHTPCSRQVVKGV